VEAVSSSNGYAYNNRDLLITILDFYHFISHQQSSNDDSTGGCINVP
jgi:hypothetical protein